MGLNRYDKKRDKNEPLIRAELLGRGVISWQLDTPVDLLCWSVVEDKFFLIEVKNKEGKNKFTDAQVDFFVQVSELGLPVFIVHEADDIERILGKIA